MFLRHLSRIRRTITFRLILWYSTFFIVSTSFLFIIVMACCLHPYGKRTGRRSIKNSVNMPLNIGQVA